VSECVCVCACVCERKREFVCARVSVCMCQCVCVCVCVCVCECLSQCTSVHKAKRLGLPKKISHSKSNYNGELTVVCECGSSDKYAREPCNRQGRMHTVLFSGCQCLQSSVGKKTVNGTASQYILHDRLSPLAHVA
jgi:hypothetical protein